MSELSPADARRALDEGAVLHFCAAPGRGALWLSAEAFDSRRLLGLLREAGGTLASGRLRLEQGALRIEASRTDLEGLDALLSDRLGSLPIGTIGLDLREEEPEEEPEDEDDEDSWGALLGGADEDEEPEEEPEDEDDEDSWGALLATVDAAAEQDEQEPDDAGVRWRSAVAAATAALPALDATSLGQALRQALADAEPGDTLHLLWAPGGPAGSVLLLSRDLPSPARLGALRQAVGLSADPSAAEAGEELLRGTLSAPDGRLLLAVEAPEEPRFVRSLAETWSRFVPPLGSCRRVAFDPAGPPAAAPVDPTPLVRALARLEAEARTHMLRARTKAWAEQPALPTLDLSGLSPEQAGRVDAPAAKAATALQRLLDAVEQALQDATDPTRRALLEASQARIEADRARVAAVQAGLPRSP